MQRGAKTVEQAGGKNESSQKSGKSGPLLSSATDAVSHKVGSWHAVAKTRHGTQVSIPKSRGDPGQLRDCQSCSVLPLSCKHLPLASCSSGTPCNCFWHPCWTDHPADPPMAVFENLNFWFKSVCAKLLQEREKKNLWENKDYFCSGSGCENVTTWTSLHTYAS